MMKRISQKTSILQKLLFQNEQGFSLLEMSIVLGIIVFVASGAAAFLTGQVKRNQNLIIAQQTREMMKAAEAYITQNHKIIEPLAYPNPHFIPVQTLKDGGFLSPSFNNWNVYGQQYGILVKKIRAHDLEALIISYGGDPMDVKVGNTIAMAIGAAGGFITGNEAVGALAGWKITGAAFHSYRGAAQAPTNGHMAALLFFNRGSLLSNYLHRYAVDGYPEANQMFVHIDLNQNDLNNANKITAKEVKLETLTAGSQQLKEAQFQTLNRLHQITCPAGEALTRTQNGTFVCVSSVPQGTIAAFAGNCPAGWSQFEAANGRFLIGAGRLGPHNYDVGAVGGEASHTLTIDEMPSHNHTYFTGTGEKTLGSGKPANAENGNNFQLLPTNHTGGNRPHENRPPYYAVRYCKKN